jgi:hypothetical protein
MSSRHWFACIGISVVFFGCGGPAKTILPTTALTEEQIQKLKQEDQNIEQAESQGMGSGGKIQAKKK